MVSTSAPHWKTSSAICGVTPKPPAAFSTLMIVRSTLCDAAYVADVLAHDFASRAAEDVADEQDIQWCPGLL